MGTKPTKKVAKVAKKAAKKVGAKKEKAPKAAKVEKTEKVTPAKGSVIFEVTAVIPTQQYGNIQPKIQVIANTVEEGRAMVMPMIEELYKQYAESPLGRRAPELTGRATVTAEEKKVDLKEVVDNESTTVTKPIEVVPGKIESLKPEATPETAPEVSFAPAIDPNSPRQKALVNGQGAIRAASNHQALDLVKGKIEQSTKIDPADKPSLFQLIEQRKTEVPF